MATKALRWGDNDRYFGPFTWALDKEYRHCGIVLSSEDDEERPCNLRISMGGATLIIRLPPIVKPWREKVYPKWDAATVERLGRDWYWNVDPREYGICLGEGGHFNVMYGRTGGRMMDSSVAQRWGCFLPWTQWRHVRRSLYGADGSHFWTELKGRDWEAAHQAEVACPKARFLIEDQDGTRITATTCIEEREWRFGEGWFKWLSLFRRPMVRRSLRIEFADEVGPEKGSWKGGLIGDGIDMLSDELHEAAFRRYCEMEHRAKSRRYRIKFVGAA